MKMMYKISSYGVPGLVIITTTINSVFVAIFSLVFFETGFLCLAYTGIHSVDLAELELRDLPASVP